MLNYKFFSKRIFNAGETKFSIKKLIKLIFPIIIISSNLLVSPNAKFLILLKFVRLSGEISACMSCAYSAKIKSENESKENFCRSKNEEFKTKKKTFTYFPPTSTWACHAHKLYCFSFAYHGEVKNFFNPFRALEKKFLFLLILMRHTRNLSPSSHECEWRVWEREIENKIQQIFTGFCQKITISICARVINEIAVDH